MEEAHFSSLVVNFYSKEVEVCTQLIIFSV